jgi:hypothetical protein
MELNPLLLHLHGLLPSLVHVVHRLQTQHCGVLELDEHTRAIKHMAVLYFRELLPLVLQEEKALHPSDYLIG